MKEEIQALVLKLKSSSKEDLEVKVMDAINYGYEEEGAIRMDSFGMYVQEMKRV